MNPMQFVLGVCLLVISSAVNAGFVKVVVGGEVDFVDPTASGVSVGDPVMGEAIYDESLVGGGIGFIYGLGEVAFPFPVFPGSLSLSVAGFNFTEQDDALFTSFSVPLLEFDFGVLARLNFATGPLGVAAFGIPDSSIQFSTAGPGSISSARFSFGFDRDFNGFNEDSRVEGFFTFSDPMPVPEPTSLLLLSLGLAGLGFARRAQ